MTNAQKTRLHNDWKKISGENMYMEEISGAIYAFCTELAALRLFHKYGGVNSIAGYSKNRQSWFFRLEASL